MDKKKEQHWKKYRKPKKEKSKLYCYLYGLCDLVCFVGGTFLFSLALFSKCITTACSIYCGCLGFIGLPLITLGFLIRNWNGRCCCCKRYTHC